MPTEKFKRFFYYLALTFVIPCETIIRLFKKKKDVLLVIGYRSICERALFLGESLRKNPGIRTWVSFTTPHKLTKEEATALKAEYRYVPYWLARFLRWDLLIFSNHDRPFRHDAKKAYVRHGLSVNKLDENGDLVIFGKLGHDPEGDFRYDKVFVESEHLKDIIIRKYPSMEDRLLVGGSLYMEQVCSEKESRDALYKKYSLDPSRKTVLVLSTWGNSLIHFGGNVLLGKLPVILEKYNVIFSVHPKASNPKDPNYDPVSKRFADLQGKTPYYLFARHGSWTDLVHHCDLLITDSTSGCFYCLPFVSGVIFFDAPGADLWDEAPISELKKISTTVNDFSGLPDRIESEFNAGKKERYAALSRNVLGDYSVSRKTHENEIIKLLKEG